MSSQLHWISRLYLFAVLSHFRSDAAKCSCYSDLPEQCVNADHMGRTKDEACGNKLSFFFPFSSYNKTRCEPHIQQHLNSKLCMSQVKLFTISDFLSMKESSELHASNQVKLWFKMLKLGRKSRVSFADGSNLQYFNGGDLKVGDEGSFTVGTPLQLKGNSSTEISIGNRSKLCFDCSSASAPCILDVGHIKVDDGSDLTVELNNEAEKAFEFDIPKLIVRPSATCTVKASIRQAPRNIERGRPGIETVSEHPDIFRSCVLGQLSHGVCACEMSEENCCGQKFNQCTTTMENRKLPDKRVIGACYSKAVGAFELCKNKVDISIEKSANLCTYIAEVNIGKSIVMKSSSKALLHGIRLDVGKLELGEGSSFTIEAPVQKLTPNFHFSGHDSSAVISQNAEVKFTGAINTNIDKLAVGQKSLLSVTGPAAAENPGIFEISGTVKLANDAYVNFILGPKQIIKVSSVSFPGGKTCTFDATDKSIDVDGDVADACVDTDSSKTSSAAPSGVNPTALTVVTSSITEIPSPLFSIQTVTSRTAGGTTGMNAAENLTTTMALTPAENSTADHHHTHETCCISDLLERCETLEKSASQTDRLSRIEGKCGEIAFPRTLQNSSCASYINQSHDSHLCIKDYSTLILQRSFVMAKYSRLSLKRYAEHRLTDKIIIGDTSICENASGSIAANRIDFKGDLTVKKYGGFVIKGFSRAVGDEKAAVTIGENSTFSAEGIIVLDDGKERHCRDKCTLKIRNVTLGANSSLALECLWPTVWHQRQSTARESAVCELKDVYVPSGMECGQVKVIPKDVGKVDSQIATHPTHGPCTFMNLAPGVCACQKHKETCCRQRTFHKCIYTFYNLFTRVGRTEIDLCYTEPVGNFKTCTKSEDCPYVTNCEPLNSDIHPEAKFCSYVTEIDIRKELEMKAGSTVDLNGVRFEVNRLRMGKDSNLTISCPISSLKPSYKFSVVANNNVPRWDSKVILETEAKMEVIGAVDNNINWVKVGSDSSFLIQAPNFNIKQPEVPNFEVVTHFELHNKNRVQIFLNKEDKVKLAKVDLYDGAFLSFGSNVSTVSATKLESTGQVSVETGAKLMVMMKGTIEIANIHLSKASSLNIKSTSTGPAASSLTVPGKLTLEANAHISFLIGSGKVVEFNYAIAKENTKCTVDATDDSIKWAMVYIKDDGNGKCITEAYTTTTTTTTPTTTTTRKPWVPPWLARTTRRPNDPLPPPPDSGMGRSNDNIGTGLYVSLGVIGGGVVIGVIIYLIVRHNRQRHIAAITPASPVQPMMMQPVDPYNQPMQMQQVYGQPVQQFVQPQFYPVEQPVVMQ